MATERPIYPNVEERQRDLIFRLIEKGQEAFNSSPRRGNTLLAAAIKLEIGYKLDKPTE